MLKEKTLPELYLLADQARAQLRSRLKAQAREYSDRSKRLENLMRHIANGTETSTLPGVPSAVSLTPDLERLILDPTHGL